MQVKQRSNYLYAVGAVAVVVVLVVVVAMTAARHAVPHVRDNHEADDVLVARNGAAEVSAKPGERGSVIARHASQYMGWAHRSHGEALDATAEAEPLRKPSLLLTPVSSGSAMAVNDRSLADEAIHPPGDSMQSAHAYRTDEEKHVALAACHQAVRCRKYVSAQKGITTLLTRSDISNPEMAENALEALDRWDAIVQANRQSCEGVSPEEIDQRLFGFSLQAGRDGNLEAQGCFVMGDFFEHGGYGEHGDWKEDYLAHAPGFMQHGIDAGYWPTVSVAVAILSDSSGLPPLWQDLPRPDPYEVYRAVRLAYYRSNSSGALRLQEHMQVLESRYHLSQDVVTQADRWAQKVYQEQFSGSPPFDPRLSEDCQ